MSENNLYCETNEVHHALLKIVKEKMPEDEKLFDLAELFKVFGDSTRMKILFVLFEAEVCTCDLAVDLNMTSSAISLDRSPILLRSAVRMIGRTAATYASKADVIFCVISVVLEIVSKGAFIVSAISVMGLIEALSSSACRKRGYSDCISFA